MINSYWLSILFLLPPNYIPYPSDPDMLEIGNGNMLEVGNGNMTIYLHYWFIISFGIFVEEEMYCDFF